MGKLLAPLEQHKRKIPMKKTAFILAALFLCASAFATSKPVQPDYSSEANSASHAGAIAGAAAGASSHSGVQADLKLQSSSTLSATTGSINNTTQGDGSTRVFVAPAPSAASLPPAYGCLTSSSFAAGMAWNFVSAAKADQKSDAVCAGLKLADDYQANCQYLNAALMRERVAHSLFPSAGAMQTAPGLVNLSPAECRALTASK